MASTSDRIPFGDLARQVRAHRALIDAAIARVLERGSFILGEEGRAFEAELARFCGAAHAVGCASGTDAIQLALYAGGVRAGDEVVVPALTAMPTATAVRQLGATPVFADVDPATGLVTAETIEPVMTSATRAVVVVHLYGQACALAPIAALTARRGVVLVEDAAQAIGARDGGRPIGWAGAATTFSFYPSKNLGAFGDGGAILTNDAALDGALRRLRDYGQTARYRHDEWGINSRLDELQAAILRARLPLLAGWNERRRAIAAAYDAAFAGGGRARPLTNRQGDGHVRHLYPVRCADPASFRDAFAARGIDTGAHYPFALPEQKALAGSRGQWRQAAALAHGHVTLPIYPELTDDEVARVAAAIAAYR